MPALISAFCNVRTFSLFWPRTGSESMVIGDPGTGATATTGAATGVASITAKVSGFGQNAGYYFKSGNALILEELIVYLKHRVLLRANQDYMLL